MIVIELTGKTFDDNCALAGTAVEKFAEDHEPNVVIENDGIGSYEYWGAKGYDYGTNYAELEETGPYTFGFDLSGMTADEIEDFLSGFDGEYAATFKREYEGRRNTNDVYVDAAFLTKVGEKVGNLHTITGEWINRN